MMVMMMEGEETGGGVERMEGKVKQMEETTMTQHGGRREEGVE